MKSQSLSLASMKTSTKPTMLSIRRRVNSNDTLSILERLCLQKINEFNLVMPSTDMRLRCQVIMLKEIESQKSSNSHHKKMVSKDFTHR